MKGSHHQQLACHNKLLMVSTLAYGEDSEQVDLRKKTRASHHQPLCDCTVPRNVICDIHT
ncbi:hypothetical protein SAMN05660860_02643 [Geoalkalibacter ferrihydriticus]|uniref:Uncharacterized protein n=2 Tax=Geoalkalibacter ferrihydriticus TaxID=392333 RepID=A0A0C2EBT6_9BACT|nr:hypothetical protein GFER_12290 [Geoalkalibacter ferrihydriticus DSM 17813]SDM48622.1 hypothetical protein SAMN05660860_02643 [Geoalkalibacter ferrihydriticus]